MTIALPDPEALVRSLADGMRGVISPDAGLVGIYTGGGQFVHAENESTGVQVSDLNSDYYGSRWAGATRLA